MASARVERPKTWPQRVKGRGRNHPCRVSWWILGLIEQGLTLVTLSVRCEYFHELSAFDALTIRMRLADLAPHRMSLEFEYWREQAEGEQLVARGGQELACMMRRDGPGGSKVEPEPWPTPLREALRPYLDHAV